MGGINAEDKLHIIDSHVHFWQPAVLRYPWLDELPRLNRTFLPADLPRQGQNWMVDKLIFVQADCLPEQGMAEVAWVSALAAKAPIAGIVAFAPLELGDGALMALEQLQAFPLVKGVRRLIQGEAPGFCIQPAFIQGVRRLTAFGYPFEICVKHDQLADVITLVQQCPDVQFILDHSGKPNIKAGLLDPWRDQLSQLARYPNVVCKLSGLVTEADTEHWQPETLRPYIEQVLACFGHDRVMFGSDWPVVTLAATYEQWLGVLIKAVSSLSADERAQLFYDNSRQIYRL